MNAAARSIVFALMVVVWTGCGPRQPGGEATPPRPVVEPSAACPSPRPSENVRVTSAIGESNSPVVAWTGELFDISWWDMRGRFPTVHVVRLDREGVPRSREEKMPSQGKARDQSLAADAEETHLVYFDEKRVMSTRLGATRSEARALSDGANGVAAGPWGAVAWALKGNLLFRCDGMGAPPGPGRENERNVSVVHRGGIESPALAWNGSHYAVAWSRSVEGGREILLQRVRHDGSLLGPRVKVSAAGGSNREPVVIWGDGEWALAWTNAAPVAGSEQAGYRVFFAAVPERAKAPRMTRKLDFRGAAGRVALASTGREYAVAWVGNKEPMGSAIYFRRIGPDAKPIGDKVEVSDGKPLTCGRPDLAWAGDGFGVVWHDDREPAGSEVFFSFVSCGEGGEESAGDGGPEADAGEGEPDAGSGDAGAEQPGDAPGIKKVF